MSRAKDRSVLSSHTEWQVYFENSSPPPSPCPHPVLFLLSGFIIIFLIRLCHWTFIDRNQIAVFLGKAPAAKRCGSGGMRHAAQQLSLHCPHITSCLKYRQYLALPYKVKMHNTFQSFSKPSCAPPPPPPQLSYIFCMLEAGPYRTASPSAPSPPQTCPQSHPGVTHQGDSASHRSDPMAETWGIGVHCCRCRSLL